MVPLVYDSASEFHQSSAIIGSGNWYGILNVTVGGFADTLATSPYATAIDWAVEKGITAGTSDTAFSPDNKCTTAQILTFLWRAVDCPEPANSANPFNDVKADDYFYKPALWAYEKGLVSGSQFTPDTLCTRAVAVTYLWRLAGSPSAQTGGFSDVPATSDYAQAVAWAVAKGVTNGSGASTFSPENTCTRGQIVTFLYRDLVG